LIALDQLRLTRRAAADGWSPSGGGMAVSGKLARAVKFCAAGAEWALLAALRIALR